MASTSDDSDAAYYFLNFAATVIQRHFRGYLVRKQFFSEKRIKEDALQAAADAHQANMRVDTAARVIQNAWRSFQNKRIYCYYRDLIHFRERGDPREMLRAINPREADLIDAASGIHVRFRLGGDMFPPLVFYKIFTHRAVTDINAFGPRNYASEQGPTAKQINNKPTEKKKKKEFSSNSQLQDNLRQYIKPDGTLGWRATTGWYERVDNNGWRPIAERLLLDEDPVTATTKLRSMPHFHHNPAVRREERIRRAKARKLEWMRKVYAQGQTGGNDYLPQLPGSCIGDLTDDQLTELQDEVGELLDWSHHLDFHNYLSDWTSMACTLGSEAFLPPMDSTPSAKLPAPDISVHAAMTAAGVPLPAFKGGVSAACSVTTGMTACMS